jgi:hypothetical protein
MFPSPFTKGLVALVENGCVVAERSAQYSFSEGSIIENYMKKIRYFILQSKN